MVPIGNVVTTHGLDGWFKVNPFNPETTALETVCSVYLERAGDHSVYRLEASKRQNRQILVKLEGVDGLDAAKQIVGATLCVTEDSLPALEPGQYYHFQTIGLEVFDVEGHRLGTITRTWSAGGGEIYIITGSGKEYMIPAVKEIVEQIDFDQRKMIINPPDGLLDL